MEVSKLLQFKNVTQINSLEELNNKININLIEEGFEDVEFNLPKKSLFLFDSPDLNSAFLHEWCVNKLSTLTDGQLDGFDVYHIPVNDEISKVISKHHKNIGYDWDVKDSKANKMNPNPMFKIFMFIVLGEDNEYFWKSDDFDIINENIVTSSIDILVLN